MEALNVFFIVAAAIIAACIAVLAVLAVLAVIYVAKALRED